ncbi:MAG: tRNA (adenosine(37)-N6)-threonylcarbamoyltransferase complex ATPase subunit type 1 TsaE [Bacteroidaceae bacterium]|nr:tRNA (adenosine(37)-N6)-threonylcarbamoyltransferase complex ATPase subunit type 1 TsaE [Bacteroidaceae bacterium]
MEIKVKSLDEIDAAARQFLSEIGDARIIAFYAKMGAGKTTFTRALCKALGVVQTVTSPTFAIINEYEGPVYHFDFYRLKRLSEAYDMGFEDYLYSGAWCLIEWPELIEDLLPQETVRVHIEVCDDGSRNIIF